MPEWKEEDFDTPEDWNNYVLNGPFVGWDLNAYLKERIEREKKNADS